MRRRSTLRSQRLRRQQWQRGQNILFLLVGMCLAGVGYWFVFFTPFFQIRSVNVQGFDNSISSAVNTYLQENTNRFIPSFLLLLFPQLGKYKMNFLTLSPSSLEAFLLKQYPLLSTVHSHLDILDHSLSLNCSRREMEFRWCIGEKQCYFVDKEGIAFQKSSEIAGSLMKTIRDERGKNIALGQRVFSPARLRVLNKVFDISQAKDSPFTVSYLEIDDNNFSSLQLMTTNGWFLLFSPQDDFLQIKNIVKGLKEKQLKEKMKDLQYIDCRYLPKVYYRFRS